jgi:uroporphyrinogen-III synthase
MLGGDAGVLQGLDIACIGPVTADAAREHGLQPTIVATTYTIPGLVAAIRGYYLEKVAGGSIAP